MRGREKKIAKAKPEKAKNAVPGFRPRVGGSTTLTPLSHHDLRESMTGVYHKWAAGGALTGARAMAGLDRLAQSFEARALELRY